MKRISPPSAHGISQVQDSFLRYQNQAFESRSPSFFALELAGECGELCNLEKKIWRDDSLPIDMAHLSDEAADIFIALTNYCNSRGIDLQNAVTLKLERIEDKRLAGKMGKIKTAE